MKREGVQPPLNLLQDNDSFKASPGAPSFDDLRLVQTDDRFSQGMSQGSPTLPTEGLIPASLSLSV